MVFILLSFLTVSISAEENNRESLKKVSIQLSWKYQYEFAQIIAAYEKGFYREAGLDVEIREGAPTINTVDQVVNNQADFGVFSSALVVEYAKGKPVVVLAALMQHSAVGLILKNSQNVKGVHDLEGKTVIVSLDTRDEIFAYLQNIGLDIQQINFVLKKQYDFEKLFEQASAASSYISNEGFHTLGRENEFQLLTPRSAGIDFFGNVLFSSKQKVKDDPELVKAFTKATLRGLKYAIQNQEEITNIILAKYNTQNKSREHLLYEAKKIDELTRPDIVEPGYMSVGRWKHVAQTYASFGKVPQDLDLLDFIYDPNKPTNLTPYYIAIVISIILLLIISVILWFSKQFTHKLQREIKVRKDMEVLLRNSEARFKDLFDNNPDPCWLIDGISFTECNQAAVDILGYPDKQSLTSVHPSQVSPDTQPDHRPSKEKAEEMIGIANEKGIHRFEWVHKKLNGQTFPVEVTLAKTSIDGRGIIYCVWRDITERKYIESLKDEFVSTVSHEIRTPLTSIMGSLGLLKGGMAGELTEQVQSLVNVSHDNAKRLLLLINDLLDISKLETSKLACDLKICDLTKLLEQSISANEYYSEQYNVTLRLKNSLDKATVYADSDRLMQVMNNLISNAVKFSNEGSEVEIELEQGANEFVIKVRDSGTGIPEEFHDKIFEKFTQADSSDTRKVGGTGLGLSISQAIIKEHDGEISFESTPGEGTTFIVRLPEVQEK